MIRRVLTLALLFFPVLSQAQLSFEGAHADLYFPHLADGGAAAYKWQTTLAFLNTNSSVPAHIGLEFFSDSGAPLPLDFGEGPTTNVTLTIPAGGTQTLTSRATSPTTVSGWAVAACDQAVQGTLTFRGIVNGTPQQAVSALATLPGLEYISPATYLTGVALANVYSTPVTLQVNATDSAGNTAGNATVTLAANGHMAFNLNSVIRSLSPSFAGSVSVSAIEANTYFVGWTLAVDNSGVMSSYPPGTLEWPISHVDRIWDVYYRDLNGAQLLANSSNLGLVVNSQAVPLHIQSDSYLNAFASKADNSINIEVALSELISDSPSELAFVIGHEMGHTMQFRTGKYLFNPDPEWDADMWGMLISLGAGYDPYAAAGALAKISMATGDASLSNQFVDNGSGDPHGSFNTRLANIYTMLQQACGLPSVAATCAQYRGLIHPHFPSSTPLDKKPVTALNVVRP